MKCYELVITISPNWLSEMDDMDIGEDGIKPETVGDYFLLGYTLGDSIELSNNNKGD